MNVGSNVQSLVDREMVQFGDLGTVEAVDGSLFTVRFYAENDALIQVIQLEATDLLDLKEWGFE